MSLKAALNGGKAKLKEEVGSTLRFEIKLEKPTDSSTNEVHYTDLLNEKNSKDVHNPLEPFQKDEDAEVEALAKRFEEKYGSSSRKRVREEDLIDLGDGYDLNDPFVDDGEAYEDYVPHEVDTLLGGFYINAGSLEYRKAEGTEEIPLKRKSKPSLKKQTSSTPKARLASKKVKLAKQQIATSAQRNETMKKKLSSLTKSSTGTLLFPASKKPHIGNSNGVSNSSSNTNVSSIMKDDMSRDASDDTNDNGPKKKESVFETPPTFPSDISPSIESKIKRIETMVSEADGKLTMKARYAYDSILIEIESETREMKGKSRSAIFDYLGYVMGITRASLMNRIKRTIKKNKGTDGGESTLQLLKATIDEILPEYVNKYDKEMTEYEAALKTADAVTADQQDKMDISKESEDFQTPSNVIKIPGEISSIAQTKLKKPRKIFKWSPKLKSLLCDVVREKVEMELANKQRTKSGEDVIMEFLQTTIKPLWPQGWFVKKTLYNITQPVHTEITGYQKKVPVKKEKQTEDNQLKQVTPLPDLSMNEGSTQASYGSILESAPSLKQQTTPTPLTSSTPTTSPSATLLSSKKNDGKSFEGVVKSSPLTSSTSSKPTLMPSKYFHSASSTVTPTTVTIGSSTMSIKSSSLNKTKTTPPTKILDGGTLKIKSQQSEKGQQPQQAAKGHQTQSKKGHQSQQSGKVQLSGKVQPFALSPVVAMPNTKSLKPQPLAKETTTKSPIRTVPQKGPTKVTTLTDIHVSQKDLDKLISSLKNNTLPLSVSPQQLQLLIQHSQKSSSPKTASSSKTANTPPQIPSKTTNKMVTSPSPVPNTVTKKIVQPSNITGGSSGVSPLLPKTPSKPPPTSPITRHVPSPTISVTPTWTLPHSTPPQPTKPQVIKTVPNTVSSPFGIPSNSSSSVVRKANISGMSIRGGTSSKTGASPVRTPNTTSAFNFNELPIVQSTIPHANAPNRSVVHTSGSGTRPHLVSVVQNQSQFAPFYNTTSSEHTYVPSVTIASLNMVPPPTIPQPRFPVPSSTTTSSSTTNFPASTSTTYHQRKTF